MAEHKLAVTLESAADAVANGDSLESIARPFLELLHTVTDLDSTYLTEINWGERIQSIRYSDNRGSLDIPEGVSVPWEGTVCKKALEDGPRSSSNVPVDFPDVQAAQDMGLQTYVSVPVRDHDDEVLGTLCGASGESVPVSEEVELVMEMFAQLIGDRWERDRRQEQATERADRAEQQLRDRTMFLAEAEHQMKSPLAVIKGWSSLLTSAWDNMPDEQRREGVGLIRDSSVRLNEQVDDLLHEARNAVMTADIKTHRLCIAPMMRRLGRELSGVSAAHPVIVDVPDDCCAQVDERALWQTMVHLVENAIKYSPHGGSIEISSAPQGPNLVISVRDHGLGVPDDVNVFDAFQRSNEERFANIPGTGVGLHIVRQLVTAMEGSISAKRNLDGGSTFVVRLRS